MKILVATDGSAAAIHAVEYAVKLVGLLASSSKSITLICVHDDIGLRSAGSFVGRDVVAAYLREVSEKELQATSELMASSGIQYETVMRTGHVAQQIVEHAKTGGFDMIVLGCKGWGAVADLLLGSVAQRVLVTASVPVLLVK